MMKLLLLFHEMVAFLRGVWRKEGTGSITGRCERLGRGIDDGGAYAGILDGSFGVMRVLDAYGSVGVVAAVIPRVP